MQAITLLTVNKGQYSHSNQIWLKDFCLHEFPGYDRKKAIDYANEVAKRLNTTVIRATKKET